MKALTIRPEWVWAMRHLDKRIENRVWAPPRNFVKQYLAIHTAGRWGTNNNIRAAMLPVLDAARRAGWTVHCGAHVFSARKGPSYISTSFEHLPEMLSIGSIVAVAVLGGVDWCPVVDSRITPWGMSKHYHWRLYIPIWFRHAVKHKGKQRLWTIDNAILPQEGGYQWTWT